ncbi:MAG TPA: hypothetical protein VFU23_01490 [Gemmatimonadales bacterium]|nr:hypothetical protein [Gemmatimonadales bacterium]
MNEPAAPLRDVAIIGGGCYGAFYASQLEAACRKDKLRLRRVLVVDRDPSCRAARALAPLSGREIVTAEWDNFLPDFLSADPPAPGQPDDAVVPSPLMPHLMAGWLLAVARERWPGRAADLAVPDLPLGTPYDALGPDGTRYVSFADWICPTHCVEPLTCPMIRAPRTWEMGDALARYVERLDRRRPTAGPALFTTRHHAYGVGMFGAEEIRASRSVVEAAGRSGEPVDIVVGTVSACHGAVSVLRLGERPAD